MSFRALLPEIYKKEGQGVQFAQPPPPRFNRVKPHLVVNLYNAHFSPLSLMLPTFY